MVSSRNIPTPNGNDIAFIAETMVNRFILVIPAFNEVGTIHDVASRALHYVKQVVVVDDGSTDGTSQALADLPITVLKNPENMGKAASLWVGFQHARKVGAEAVITIDGDGQHAPEDISSVLAGSERWAKFLILGTRVRTDCGSVLTIRALANRVADFWISWAAGYPIADSQSGFRVYPMTLLQKLNVKHGKKQSFVFESEVLIEAARLGVFSVPIDVQALPRQGTTPSHFRPVVDILRITKMVAWRLLARGMYLRGLFQSLRGYSDHQALSAPTITSSHLHKNIGSLSLSQALDFQGEREKPTKISRRMGKKL
jgi:glycosyltransferase involved in cell wall biosynthesis